MDVLIYLQAFDKIIGNEKLLIYGTGSVGRGILKSIQKKTKGNIIGFLDDQRKSCMMEPICGISVYAPESVNSLDFDYIFLASAAYQTNMHGKLISLGIKPEKIITLKGEPISNYTSNYGEFSYSYDGLVSAHNADFMKDTLFIEAFNKIETCVTGSRQELKFHWRTHIATWAASHAKLLGTGDFIECGVAYAGTASAIMHYIGFKDMPERHYYLLDTFEGIPPDYLTKEESENGTLVNLNKHYSNSYELVKNNVAEYSNVTIIKGKVPETLSMVKTQKVAFIHIDMNSVVPEVAAANYFWDKLVPGGIMLFDDYGWAPCYIQKKGVDQFAKEKGVRVLSLPTGAGLIIKC